MRLLLLPISTKRALVYCEPTSHSLPVAKQNLLDKGVAKASKTWTEWEQSTTKWKRKTTEYGNGMLRRIPYQEWGLKSIPSLRQHNLDGYAGGEKVEVKYPTKFHALGQESILDACRRLGTERQSLHRTKAIYSVIGMPFTIPFGLIPILPNLPFLYLLFRAYSHWRAFSGSKHLQYLCEKKLLQPVASDTLDSLYSKGLLYKSIEESQTGQEPTKEQTDKIVGTIRGQTGALQDPKEIMLLSSWNAKAIADKLELPGLQIELERAVEQVQLELNKPQDGQKADEKR